MKSIRYNILVLHILALMPGVLDTAGAGQVTQPTLSSGSGSTGSGTRQARLTVGQGIIGRTSPANGQTGVDLGFWSALNGTYVAAPVGDVTPVIGNQLFRNYPNPFNPSTQLEYSLARQSEVRLEVYDLRGRRVDTLLREVQPAGRYSFTYQPRNLPSGVYLVLMRADGFRASQRIMLIK